MFDNNTTTPLGQSYTILASGQRVLKPHGVQPRGGRKEARGLGLEIRHLGPGTTVLEFGISG